jgi:hypothetical protein
VTKEIAMSEATSNDDQPEIEPEGAESESDTAGSTADDIQLKVRKLERPVRPRGVLAD